MNKKIFQWLNGVLIDPLPVVSLPAKEYLEITNRTGFSFNMKNWRLATESRSELFPSKIIAAGARLIICSVSDTISFGEYGTVVGLKQFPSLNDTRMTLSLSDSSGSLIHGIEYSSDWYRDELKSSGGWAIEIIDPGFPFYTEGNWSASKARKGGTPGKENSVTKINQDDRSCAHRA